MSFDDEIIAIRMARSLENLTDEQLGSYWYRLKTYVRAGLADREVREVIDACALKFEQERRGRLVVSTPLAKEE